jgi:hypothetical protein
MRKKTIIFAAQAVFILCMLMACGKDGTVSSTNSPEKSQAFEPDGQCF